LRIFVYILLQICFLYEIISGHRKLTLFVAFTLNIYLILLWVHLQTNY